MKIITNNKKRPLLSGWELSDSERRELDYVAPLDDRETWSEQINRFFRFRGNVYDTFEFSRLVKPGERCNAFEHTVAEGSELAKWDAIQTDSYFSGVVIRYPDKLDYCDVVVGVAIW